MKKIYSCFSTLIFFSFLFTLNSCRANSSLLLDTSLGNVNAEKEINYYKSIKDDAITTNIENLYDSAVSYNNDFATNHTVSLHSLEGMPAYAVTIDPFGPIDPDWRKLIG
jgi:hypothetical protein